MPKIIENLEDRLISEAKKQIEQQGYAAVTIRSIAKSCGVGVGTIYNYFPSKDALLASYMLADWKGCILAINAVSTYSRESGPVVQCICDQLTAFSKKHETVFRDEAAFASFAGSFSKYHTLLRSQLADPLRKFCDSDCTADFIAESLLTWTMAGKTFAEIYGVIEKLFSRTDA
jgi:AcrR family transcriptional regulator